MPPCSKLISHSYTTFETNVPNESVIKIDYLNDTLPSNLPGLRQQYLNGDLINCKHGCIFINQGDKTYDNSICIEIGNELNKGSNYSISRYLISNISIYKYNIGIMHNNYNIYIGNYNHLHLEGNNINVQFGRTGSIPQNTSNNGENMSFIECIIASSNIAFKFITSGWNVSLTKNTPK